MTRNSPYGFCGPQSPSRFCRRWRRWDPTDGFTLPLIRTFPFASEGRRRITVGHFSSARANQSDMPDDFALLTSKETGPVALPCQIRRPPQCFAGRTRFVLVEIDDLTAKSIMRTISVVDAARGSVPIHVLSPEHRDPVLPAAIYLSMRWR